MRVLCVGGGGGYVWVSVSEGGMYEGVCVRVCVIQYGL